ncbi:MULTISPECIES: RNA polymerase sigma factor [unclassified Streptomyces]|uniref:RNA polymerase sigma factor n=1 Tax=unclassified Streptomyces TaxID=2593676 RepID=UPI00307833A9
MPGTATERGTEQVAALSETDKERWGRLFEQYHPWVVRRLNARLSDRALAEDIASEVFIRLGKSLPTLDPARDDRLYAWLATISRGLVVDHWRYARTRREELSRPADDTDGAPSMPEKVATDALSCPEETVVQYAEVRRLLHLLPASERQALTLHALDGLSTVEAAAVMGVSRRTVLNRLHAAMAVLRPVMQEGPAELWENVARRAALCEASTGRAFTSADLVARHNVAVPQSPAKWRTLFSELRKEGVIRQAGPGKNRVTAWVGVTVSGQTVASDRMAVAA